ncbi:hypothetical protein A1359_21230 [Methylomonas lenta]|uniref:PEP-CTERM sorting domain-containing protein n=1 Tax=Methylomonas lenta TaxID=980561 RepID=A0A177NQB1_9GAMM|nr:hypothetical protein [Methylomonas lenta]OAI20268.1 hypothetical protein A1359_21230 [Methylomonas lenta]
MIKGIFKIALLAGLFFSATSAHALQSYIFTQDGFAGGGSITGSFAGNDLNSDGFIQGAIFNAGGLSEITSFSVSWSGNDTIPAFSHTSSDLTFFSFDTAKSTLGQVNPEGIATNWFGLTGYQYLTGQGVNSYNGSYVVNAETLVNVETFGLINVAPVTSVPLPGAAWLFGPALLSVFRLKRRSA